MSTTTAATPILTVRRAGLLGALGGVVGAIGALTIFVVSQSSTVDDELVRAPVSATAFVLTEPVWSLTHLLALLSVIGLWRSGAAGVTTLARRGLWATATGMALLVIAELSLLLFADQRETATGPAVLSGVFGIASLLVCGGMIVVGRAVLRTGAWTGWGRATTLIVGLMGILLVLLGPTSLFLLGIAAWNVALAAFGLALSHQPDSRSAAATGAPRAERGVVRTAA